jgi:hypothetical protein
MAEDIYIAACGNLGVIPAIDPKKIIVIYRVVFNIQQKAPSCGGTK